MILFTKVEDVQGDINNQARRYMLDLKGVLAKYKTKVICSRAVFC
jgi:hypothetical protein